MNTFIKQRSTTDIWNISGSFGNFDEVFETKENSFISKNAEISVKSDIKKDKNGVYIRTGVVKNISDKEIHINTLASKFSLDGGEYEVYSQYNGWQNESLGAWQPLVSSVVARSQSIRQTNSATPFMALFNCQTKRGTAFHLNAYSTWEMRISRAFSMAGEEYTHIECELGVLNDGLDIKLNPGEEVELPEIIYYEFSNKTDMDCYKLHSYLNEEYPRKAMPVIYNTWLYKFDTFTFDDILSQIEKAASLGVEYFVIDAGWFGKGKDWWETRGDWEENMTFGVKGRMEEISEEVKKHGMKFGFWLEPECASKEADIVKKYPHYFLKGDSYFIDFSNNEALEYIFNKTCELIDRYEAEFLKFDFNADLFYDKSHTAFINYYKGHTKYIKMLKEKYPDLYIENCASGGTRMAIRDGKLFDSYWFSDNQSPYFGMRIFKETVLRMPPQWIERWACITSIENKFLDYEKRVYVDKIIACNDAKWNDVAGIHLSFLKGFLTGSPICFSCDLTSFSKELFSELRDFIAEFKKNRDFWQKAVCHILTDTDSMLVLEFRDEDFSNIEIVAFAKKILQNNICVYPYTDKKSDYEISENKIISSGEIEENGINMRVTDCYTAQFLSMKKVIN